jgi:excisionase family DNA binding protein
MSAKKIVVAVAPAVVVPIPSDDLLTLQEVADRLKFTTRQVYELTRARSKRPLPMMRAGKHLRFSWASVSEWLHAGAR